MSYFTYFDFTYNNDKKEVVTINMPQNLGKQLFNIATAYTYSVNNSKKLIFENIDNNTINKEDSIEDKKSMA